jgi:hypothetical protein
MSWMFTTARAEKISVGSRGYRLHQGLLHIGYLLKEEYVMARAIYPHELTDPDFQWLVSTFRENRPNLLVVEETSLPLVFILLDSVTQESDADTSASAESVVLQGAAPMTEQREETPEH